MLFLPGVSKWNHHLGPRMLMLFSGGCDGAGVSPCNWKDISIHVNITRQPPACTLPPSLTSTLPPLHTYPPHEPTTSSPPHGPPPHHLLPSPRTPSHQILPAATSSLLPQARYTRPSPSPVLSPLTSPVDLARQEVPRAAVIGYILLVLSDSGYDEPAVMGGFPSLHYSEVSRSYIPR